jgi:hypothetical protein
MNNQIVIDADNVLTFRETPWDTQAFGFSTSEVLTIKYGDQLLLTELLRRYTYQAREDGVQFSYCRISAEDHDLKRALQLADYYYAETSLLLIKTDVHKEHFGKIFKNDLVVSEPQSENDYDQIKIIAKNAFNYSRFHEDPNISSEKARLRYYNWIDDLRAQNKEFLIYKTGNTVNSFITFSVDKESVTLYVGGSDLGKGFLTPFFWATFLTKLQLRGVKRVGGIMSAANVPMFNMYVKLAFKVDKVLLGFHRFSNS